MKYAIVTGGTRGIGKQICLDLLNKKYFVITNYAKNSETAELAKKDFLQISNKFRVIKVNQVNDDEINSFLKQILEITQKIDLIICNAGVTLRKNLSKITNKDWEDVFKINLHSHLYIIRDLHDVLQKKASIIFIGSRLGKIPHATSLAYGVTKSALHALSNNLVKEFSKKSIRVNVIAPGFVDTDWQKDKPDVIKKSICLKTALPRFATVKEISHACMFVLDNQFINGSTLDIDGGYNYK